jgi:phosphorylcholine metabolism protein LicD
VRARRILFEVVEMLDNKGVIYHLEGGTLLGIVRDHDLLPWDHDVDISIPISEAPKFEEIISAFYSKGYKISIRKSPSSVGVFRKGQFSLFKVKRLIPSVIKFIFPWYSKHYIVLDIFVKVKDDEFTYWQAQGKLLRVENKYYESYETIEYLDKTLKVPNFHRDYLTQKYGDWSIPVKKWECRDNEKTVYDDIFAKKNL